jgi:AGZA family xanthine/uracil permease-like MFS transporter
MGLADSVTARFDVEQHGSDLRTEVVAGITTFLAMSYIIVVNPFILAEAVQIPGYEFIEVVQMIAIATILASAAATLVMALYANRPFGRARPRRSVADGARRGLRRGDPLHLVDRRRRP